MIAANMARMRWLLVCVAFFATLQLLAPAAHSQETSGGMPDDVKTILQKVKAGEKPTPAETQRLKDWAQSMRTQMGLPAQPAKAAAGSTGSTGGAAGSCPPAQALTLPSAAPTRAEYVALVKSLAATYGPRAGQTRAKVDALLAKSPGPVAASEVGSVLLAGGAAAASVYASASAAALNPDSSLLANNLGAALNGANDQGSAVKVLLYAAKLAPKSPLIATNLGWSYFQAGQPAQAQTAFKQASSLSQNAAGAVGGMGLLAACRGDNQNAQKYLQASLDKRFSSVLAGALDKTKAGQGKGGASGPGGSGGVIPPPGGDTSTPGSSGGDTSTPSGSGGEPKLIPALPDVEDAPHGAAAKAALDRIVTSAHQRATKLVQQYQEIMQRIAQLSRRAHQDPDGALDVPVLFDKELFQFKQAWMLTFNQTFAGLRERIAQSDSARKTALQEFTGQVQVGEKKQADLSQQMQQVEQERDAKCPSLPDSASRNACQKSYQQRWDQLHHQSLEVTYEMCRQEKQMMEVSLAAEYKV